MKYIYFFLITEMNSSIFCFLQKSVILDTVKTADFSHLLLHSGISTLLRKGGWKDKERLVLSQTWFWPQGLPARISDIPGGPQSMLWERQLLTKESQTPWGVGWAGGGGVTCRTGISMFWLCSIHTTLVHRTPAHRPGRGLWKRILRLF